MSVFEEPCPVCGVVEWSLGRKYERERIIELLEADRNESHAIDDIFDGVVFQTLSRSEFKQALIALIKGETE